MQMAADSTNIKVVVRTRPYNRRELDQNQRQLVKVLDRTTLLFDPDEEDDAFFFQGAKQNYRDISKRVNKKISMEFDRVFDPDATNQQIFEECTSPLVTSVLNGYNCSVFVYGATGAGKTFTMLGNNSCPGLTILTMHELFRKIEAQSDVYKFDIGVSYLEVYNELVMNLLTKTGPLKLREDTNGVVVGGLVLTPIYGVDELFRLLAQGNANRTQHPTDANAESSRSHAVFQVHLRITDRTSRSKRTVKLSMIDLAGSERAASTKGVGLRFKEGASINKSLLALGNCINKLADGLKHIPYRDSNLTRLLKDSLGGNCQTLMVANVSMSSLTYEDTYNTLKYASRAKKIRTVIHQNVLKSNNMPKDFYVKRVGELMTENERLTDSLRSLENQYSQLENATKATSLCDESELKTWYRKIDAVYASVIKTQEYVISTESKIKNLNLCTKFQQDNISLNKMFIQKQVDLRKELANATKSISNHNKEVDKLKGESMRWRKKLHEAHKDLEKLKQEIKQSNYASFLQMYQRSKDLEVCNSKQSCNINHISSINLEFARDSDKLRKTFTMACDVLKKCYGNLDVEMQRKVEQLQKEFIRSPPSKNGYKNDSDEDIELSETNSLRIGKQICDVSDTKCILSTNTRKRQHQKRPAFSNNYELDVDDADSEGSSIFPKSSLLTNNLNETHVLTCTTDDEYDCSTDASAVKQKVGVQRTYKALHKTELISNILSEKITHVSSSKGPLKSALLRSNNFNHQGLLQAVAVGMQKENKKHIPARIRKSPRCLMVKAIPNISWERKQTSRTMISKAEPVVRSNRAALFRTNK